MPMQITLRFLSTRSGKSLVLQIDHRTYAFNVFEGFQRYCIEKRMSMASIDTIFLTSRCSVPALIGMYLTLGETERTSLNVVSSFDVDFYSVHRFSIVPDLKLNFMRSYQDKYIKVEAFEVCGVTNYIIDVCEIKGRLYPEKIPSSVPKYLYKTLVDNGYVELDRVVYKSEDFSDKSIKINKLCLIFSTEGFDQIRGRCRDIRSFFCFNRDALNFVCEDFPYLSSADVASVSGVFYVCENDMVEYESFFEVQVALSRANQSYLLPSGSGKSREETVQGMMPKGWDPQSFEIVHSNDSILFSKSNGFRLVRAAYAKTLKHLNTYHKPCLVFLGTGCAIPSKYRNVSSILYQSSSTAILLDCGEDTLSQIDRFYGSLSILKILKLIYISHSHADHMLGLASVVRRCTDPIVVVGPSSVRDFLEYFGEMVHQLNFEDTNPRGKVNFISTSDVKLLESSFYKQCGKGPVDFNDYVRELCLSHLRIRLCGCNHSKNSTSVSIYDTEEGTSFSYSGDSTPSRLFAWMSSGVDVMVHEATFNDDQWDYAIRTKHSTKNEALGIFEASKAKKLLLTHFSNRNSQEESNDICISDFYRYIF